MIIFCKSQLDLLCRERLRLQLELLRLPLVMIVQHRHHHPRDQWPESSRSLSTDESHARWGLMSITTAGNGENIPQTGAGKVSPSSSSSSLGQSWPTAGKAKRAAHFAPPALSSEVIIFRDTQTDKHFIIIYISSSLLGQSRPTAGKAVSLRASSAQLGSDDFSSQTNTQTLLHNKYIIIIIIVDENIKDFILISGHRWRRNPLWGFRPRPSCPDHTQYVRYQYRSDSFPTSF